MSCISIMSYVTLSDVHHDVMRWDMTRRDATGRDMT